MATGTRTTDTFTEGLRSVLSDIQDLKTTDNADLPFIINLETIVLQRLKQQGSDALQGVNVPNIPLPSQMGGGPGPGGGMGPPMGGPMGPMAGGGPMMPGAGPVGPPGMPPPGAPPGMPPPAIAPAAVPGLMQGPPIPPSDELRRILLRGVTANRLNTVANRIAGPGA